MNKARRMSPRMPPQSAPRWRPGGLWSDPHPVQPQDFRHGTTSPLLVDASGCRTSSEPAAGPVVGNARTHIFEWPGCPYYSSIAFDNRVPFPSPQAAEAAGYRPAHNCPWLGGV